MKLTSWAIAVVGEVYNLANVKRKIMGIGEGGHSSDAAEVRRKGKASVVATVTVLISAQTPMKPWYDP